MREFKPLLGLDDLSKHSRLLLNIRVSDTQGREKCISACQADTVKSIKEKVLDEKQAKEQSNYKVVLSRMKKALEDVKTLEQEGVEDNGMIFCGLRAVKVRGYAAVGRKFFRPP